MKVGHLGGAQLLFVSKTCSSMSSLYQVFPICQFQIFQSELTILLRNITSKGSPCILFYAGDSLLERPLILGYQHYELSWYSVVLLPQEIHSFIGSSYSYN